MVVAEQAVQFCRSSPEDFPMLVSFASDCDNADSNGVSIACTSSLGERIPATESEDGSQENTRRRTGWQSIDEACLHGVAYANLVAS